MHVAQPAEATPCRRHQERAVVIMVRRIVRMTIEDMGSLFLDLVVGMTMQGGFRLMLGRDFSHRERIVRRIFRQGNEPKAQNQRYRQDTSHDVVEEIAQSESHRVRIAMVYCRYSPSRVNKFLTGKGPHKSVFTKANRPREAKSR